MTPEQTALVELLARVQRLEHEGAVYRACISRLQEQLSLTSALAEQLARNQALPRLRVA